MSLFVKFGEFTLFPLLTSVIYSLNRAILSVSLKSVLCIIHIAQILIILLCRIFSLLEIEKQNLHIYLGMNIGKSLSV